MGIYNVKSGNYEQKAFSFWPVRRQEASTQDSQAHVIVTRPRSCSAILSNMAGLTSRSVGSQPVPVVRQWSILAFRQSVHTPIYDLEVDAHLLARTFIYTCSPNLLATQRILIRITACLHSIVKIVRHRDNSVVVSGGDTTSPKTRAVVRQIPREVIGIRGQRQESRPTINCQPEQPNISIKKQAYPDFFDSPTARPITKANKQTKATNSAMRKVLRL